MPNYPLGRTYPGYGGVWRREHRDGVEVLRSYIYPTQRAELLPRLTNYFSFVGSSAVSGTAALPRLDYLLTESPPLFLATAGYALSKLKRARWIFNVSDYGPRVLCGSACFAPVARLIGWRSVSRRSRIDTHGS